MNHHQAESTANYLDAARELVWDAADPEKPTEIRLRSIEAAEQRLQFVATMIESAKADLQRLQEKEAA